jgi:hypothetical protein
MAGSNVKTVAVSSSNRISNSNNSPMYGPAIAISGNNMIAIAIM